jgi:hypothetical protein
MRHLCCHECLPKTRGSSRGKLGREREREERKEKRKKDKERETEKERKKETQRQREKETKTKRQQRRKKEIQRAKDSPRLENQRKTSGVDSCRRCTRWARTTAAAR